MVDSGSGGTDLSWPSLTPHRSLGIGGGDNAWQSDLLRRLRSLKIQYLLTNGSEPV